MWDSAQNSWTQPLCFASQRLQEDILLSSCHLHSLVTLGSICYRTDKRLQRILKDRVDGVGPELGFSEGKAWTPFLDHRNKTV